MVLRQITGYNGFYCFFVVSCWSSQEVISLRRGVVLVLVGLCLLLHRTEPAFAQNSAVFEIIAPLPAAARAGEKVLFVVRISNTGTETWVNGEYSLSVKIYDERRDYLTQSDKVKQFKDTEPGEVLTGEIPFDIPADYAGTYYYRINLELNNGTVIESRYLQLQLRPPPPVPRPKLTGTIRTGYQATSTSRSLANFNLYLVNELPEKTYLKLTGKGSYAFKECPQLGNVLLYYRGKRTNVSLGDIRNALSDLTLDRIEGLKVDTELGPFKLIATAGRKEEASSLTQPCIWGLGATLKPTSWFDLGVSYADLMGKQDASLTSEAAEGHSTNSIAGLEVSFTPNPEITISVEYAHSIYDEDRLDEMPAEQSDAFHLSTSVYSERVSLDASYERVGEEFFFVSLASPEGNYEEYDLSLDYSLLDYLSATFFYNQYQSGLSEEKEVLRIVTGSGSLTFVFPALPVLSIGYDLDKTYSSEAGDEVINDTSSTLSFSLSYPFRKTRFSINYSKSDYRDLIEPLVDETIASIAYGITIHWNRRVTFSTRYSTSEARGSGDSAALDSRSVNLGIRYQLIPGKIVLSPEYKLTRIETEKDRISASLALSYFFTKRSILQIRYGQTNRGTATNWEERVSEEGNFSIDYTYELDKNRRLALKSTWMSSRDFESEASFEESNLSLSYEYRF